MHLEANAQPILDEGFSGDEPAPSAPAVGAAVRRAAAVTAALLLAAAVVAVGAGGTPHSSGRHSAAHPGLIGLSEHTHHPDPCHRMPQLRMVSVKSNNLGNKGPQQHEPEGIVYEAEALNTGFDPSDDIQIHIHAVSESYFGHSVSEGTPAHYTPEWARSNGISGHFGTINMKPGTNATLQLQPYDATLKKNIALPRFALSVFDLDAGEGGVRSVEFLRVKNFKAYYVTNSTELEIREARDGSYMFTATKEGSGADNPTDPLKLTPQQKNKAVTLVFEDQDEVIFELGASPGETARVFQFVLKPVIRCAWTVLADGTLLAPGDPRAPVATVVVHRSGAPGRFGFASAAVLGLALASAQLRL